MDPAEAAAAYLTATFKRMDVPCRVELTNEKGKHIIATADISEQTDLFEEVPIVSWPAQGFLALCIPFCSHCLRKRRGVEEMQEEDSAFTWHTCDSCGSLFCSETCVMSSNIAHQILCGVLKQLRETDHARDIGERNADECYRPITKESLARCVAWIVAKIATSIKEHKFSGMMLEKHHNEADKSISRQLFHIATAPFNRLIGAPSGSEFNDVDATAWYRIVVRLLWEPCRTALLEAVTAPPSCNEDWVLEILNAILCRETLETLLGQLALNSQALNGFFLCPPNMEDNSSLTSSASWVLKGGGVYTLQSAFNHSCQPNLAVMADDGTHEITLRTLHAIKKGEELTITYIPLENTTYEERRARLKGYFFTCRCCRCTEEEKKQGHECQVFASK